MQVEWKEKCKDPCTKRSLLHPRLCRERISLVFLPESLLIPFASVILFARSVASTLCATSEMITDIKIVSPLCPCCLWTYSFISRHLINESALIVRGTDLDVESISIFVKQVEWSDKIIAYYSVLYSLELRGMAFESYYINGFNILENLGLYIHTCIHTIKIYLIFEWYKMDF